VERKEVEKITREIFHKIHVAQGENKLIYQRLLNNIGINYLELENDFFQKKVCLDAGCGSVGIGILAMLKQGAKKVYAFDLDKSIFDTIPSYLAEFNGKYELSVGNVLNMKYEDNFFDFVFCSGVLHHTVNTFAGLKELARVTKPGGIMYIMTFGKGGLITEITDFLRSKYKDDEEFKECVDKLEASQLLELWEWVVGYMEKQGETIGRKIPIEIVEAFLDEDLVSTIKDRLMAPIYSRDSESEIFEPVLL
jgi:ubiquinone/menaquinone biosynthesis C-methylase UbiE